jgi:hypothetical protein
MKKMKFLYISICPVIVAFFMVSCLKGRGDVESKTFDIESFSGITNNIDADIHITQSPTQSVEILAQPNITKNISLEVTDGILKIKFKKNVRHYKPININISIPKLSSININGSGNINTTNTFDSCGVVSLDISGSGNIDAYINANSKTYSKISGSGNITLNGNSPDQDITISGSGNIHAYTFHTEYSTVKISGSGTCELTADSTLNVTISGSGNTYYKGHPVITSDISGSGTIHDSN